MIHDKKKDAQGALAYPGWEADPQKAVLAVLKSLQLIHKGFQRLAPGNIELLLRGAVLLHVQHVRLEDVRSLIVQTIPVCLVVFFLAGTRRKRHRRLVQKRTDLQGIPTQLCILVKVVLQT